MKGVVGERRGGGGGAVHLSNHEQSRSLREMEMKLHRSHLLRLRVGLRAALWGGVRGGRCAHRSHSLRQRSAAAFQVRLNLGDRLRTGWG